MRPSFSPRRVTVDEGTGSQCFDKDIVRTSMERMKPANEPSLVQGGVQAIVCGIVISIVLCPVMIGFSTIIYTHPDFEEVMPILIKLIFVSSVAHQVVVSALAPLPYAIAQVQDAGLIFLSSMGTSIMMSLGPDVPLHERIATVVIHLSLSTAFVGLGLILIGKLRLASLVQYLPTPVIGGYLAYIGFFMVKGGISLMTSVHLSNIYSWLQLFNGQLIALLSPGVIAGIGLSLITARYHHFAVFPCCILLMPIIFYMILILSGFKLADAREFGFLEKPSEATSIFDVYALFDLRAIHWEVMFPQQIPTMLSMLVVIGFASSLDIAAISMGTGTMMNYNEQLQTIGTSNVVSGLCGGYTGSMIFSQTLFSFRFHPQAIEANHPGFSRLVGISLATCEMCIALLPFSLMAVIPKFLFGSVMIFIGIELLRTWLIGVLEKLLLQEYAIVICTFLCLNAFGVQIGLGCGIGLAALFFIVEYSKSQVVRAVHKTSNVIRNAEQHSLLFSQSDSYSSVNRHPIVTIELHGHIFFGSATRIQNYVKSAVCVREQVKNEIRRSGGGSAERLPLIASATFDTRGLRNLDGSICTDQKRGPTHFVVFDFSRVSGLDATAARSCFLALKMAFKRHDIKVVYCGMKREVSFLLHTNDVIVPDSRECHVTTDLDLALEWCEQQLILSASRKKAIEKGGIAIEPTFDKQLLPLTQVLCAYLPQERRALGSTKSAISEIIGLFQTQQWKMDDEMFACGMESDQWFVLLQGQVTLFTTPGAPKLQRTSEGNTSNGDEKELVGRVRAGCIFGDLDFVLNQNRVITAVVSSHNTVTAVLTRADMEELARRRVDLAFVIQEIILRASCMNLAEKLHSIVI